MFELLLQADKALTEGSFDQAERTYWQLIELDPTNAIAVAGLARVSLERGDEQSARTFADQALGIDPDSIAARKVLDTLAHTAADPSRAEPPELPLQAAQRLEALSKRRTAAGPGADEGSAATRGGPGKKPGSRAATPATPAAADAAVGKGGTASKESRGRTRPDEIVPLPSEPLHERRQAGRQAAAAAAAAAAAREPVKARRQVHHAMPVGRRFFGPEGLKAPLADAFSEAEMAAAVAAVDALDDPSVAFVGEQDAVAQSDVMGAVDATAADESVALRLALVMDMADLEAAEREAAESIGAEADVDPFDAAEAEAAGLLSVEPSMVEPDAAADAAAEAARADEISAHDFAGAESDAASEAVTEVAAADDDEFDLEPAPIRRTITETIAEEPSEEEAEAQALREAIALVLEGGAEGRSVDGTAAEVPSEPTAAEELEASVRAQVPAEKATSDAEDGPADADAAADPSIEATTNPKGTPETELGPGSPPSKRGLFHRIRGS